MIPDLLVVIVISWIATLWLSFKLGKVVENPRRLDTPKSHVCETPDKDPRGEVPEGGYKLAPTRNNPNRGTSSGEPTADRLRGYR